MPPWSCSATWAGFAVSRRHAEKPAAATRTTATAAASGFLERFLGFSGAAGGAAGATRAGAGALLAGSPGYLSPEEFERANWPGEECRPMVA